MTTAYCSPIKVNVTLKVNQLSFILNLGKSEHPYKEPLFSSAFKLDDDNCVAISTWVIPA